MTDLGDLDAEILEIEEEEDPLFGDLSKNEKMKSLLSPKLKKSSMNVLDASERVSKTTRNGLQRYDIESKLKRNSRDPLESELGFSIDDLNGTLESKKQKSSTKFSRVLEAVEREREIKQILSKKDAECDQNIQNERLITRWIENNVDPGFLNATTGAVGRTKKSDIKLHKNWIAHLRQTLKSIIATNGPNSSLEFLDEEILKYTEFTCFKCFTSPGSSFDNDCTDITYIFDRPTIGGILSSTDIPYVENIISSTHLGTASDNIHDVTDILLHLGIDPCLLEKERPIKKTFDNKKQLPYSGCGFQVLKFVKIIELDELKTRHHISLPNILKILILMASDFNVCNDIRTFRYRDGRYTGREICLLKLHEYQEEAQTINDLLPSVFSRHSSDLWFNLIKDFPLEEADDFDKTFQMKLILNFLCLNRINDQFQFQFLDKYNSSEDVQETFKIFVEIVTRMSSHQFCFGGGYEEDLRIVYEKLELMKLMIFMNDDILNKWRHDHEEKFDILKNSLHHLKSSYFKDDRNNFNSLVPKCKRIMESIYHQVSTKRSYDVFDTI